MSDPALPPGFEEDPPPPPPGFEMDTGGDAAPAPAFSSVPTLDPASGRVSQPSLPGRSSAPPTLTQKITALVETGMNLASAATGGLLGAVGGGLGAFAGSAASGGLRRQPDGRVPALDAIGTGAEEGAAGLVYNPRSELGQERAAQAAEGLSQLAPLGGLPAEVAALSSASRMVGRDLRTAGSAALDANRKFNATRTVAQEVKAAKEAALNASTQEGRQAAREAGFVLTPTEAGAGKLARTTEGLGGEAKLQKGASQKNAELVNAAIRKDVQLADDVPLSREALASKRKEAGAAYAAIKDVGDIQNDTEYMSALDKIAEGYDTAAKSFPHRSENPFKKTLDGLKQKTVSASSAIEEVKLLRNDADKAFKAGDKALGKAYRDAANAVDDSIDRHLTRAAATDKNPDLVGAVQKYRDARKLIAKTYLADKAINETTGNVNAAAYVRQLDKGVKLDGEALKVAKFAKQFPKLAQPVEKLGNTGSATAGDAALALLGKTAAVAMVRPAARGALLTETVQNRMVPKRKSQAPTPKPEITAEQSPFPAREDGVPPAGPLGDLTPDWETAPGAAAPAGRQEVVPTEGLVPAVDEAGGPARVLPAGQDRTPSKQAGQRIPAVPGRPDLPDAIVSGPRNEGLPTRTSEKGQTLPAEHPVGTTEPTGRAMQDALATIDEFEAQNPGKIPVGEATEVAPTDPRLAEIEQLQQGAKSEVVKKALTAEAARLKREIKAQVEAEKLKADVAELRQAAAGVKDVRLKERLLARADDLEKPEKIPVGEVIEGQPEIKAEKVGKIPVGKATEVPDEPTTGRAPEIEKLPVGEAKSITDSGVEEAIPTGEAKELFVPPEKTGTAEVTLTEAKGGKLQGTDAKGDPYDVSVTDRKMGAENPERSLLVEVHDPVSGQRRGFAEFVFAKDGKLSEQNVKIAPYLKKRNIEEILRRAVKQKGHELETKPGVENATKEASKPEAAPRKESTQEKAPLPEGVTIREAKDGSGFEAVNAQGNRIGYLKDNLKAGQAEQLGENANVEMVKVDKAFSGKGVGRALYQAFDQKHGGRIMPSGKTEPSAWKVWKRNYPEKVDAFVEQEVKRVKDGANSALVVRNITDPEVRARVADGVSKLKKSKP
jgi:hypothetical protein